MNFFLHSISSAMLAKKLNWQRTGNAAEGNPSGKRQHQTARTAPIQANIFDRDQFRYFLCVVAAVVDRWRGERRLAPASARASALRSPRRLTVEPGSLGGVLPDQSRRLGPNYKSVSADRAARRGPTSNGVKQREAAPLGAFYFVCFD